MASKGVAEVGAMRREDGPPSLWESEADAEGPGIVASMGVWAHWDTSAFSSGSWCGRGAHERLGSVAWHCRI